MEDKTAVIYGYNNETFHYAGLLHDTGPKFD